MKTLMQKFIIISAIILIPTSWAADLTIPNTFVSGTPAIAAEVNANFSAVETAVDDNDGRITINANGLAALQSTISALQSDLADANNSIGLLQAALADKADTSHTHAQNDITNLTGDISNLQNDLGAVQSNSVLALDGNLLYTVDANGYATARFTDINVQVVNGVGQTTKNGLGNLIVGYNGATTIINTPIVCSIPDFTDQTTCENNSGAWSRSHKTGSHNLVAGSNNSYASTGGLIYGTQNIITGINAASGGFSNVASGRASSISGGYANLSSGDRSSISGGWTHNASGLLSSITGGENNKATGSISSVHGGFNNTASGGHSSILGGNAQSNSVQFGTTPALP